jgi:RHS repeat-associated protein
MTIQRDTLRCQYRYDPQDKIVGCDLLNQESIQRFYRKDRLATELQGQARYSMIEHEDQPLAQQLSQAGRVDSVLLATDLKHSVLHSLSSGVRQASVFCPYGHRSPESGLISLLGFNGQRRDPVTGHYLLGNGYRAFNPVLMRFNSPDSLSPFGKGGVNAYAYCVGDPVNRVDPKGEFPMFIKGVSQLVSARGQLNSALNELKKGVVSVFNKSQSRLGRSALSEREGMPKTTSQLMQVSEVMDEVKLRNIGAEFRVARKAAEPPPIARFAESKGYSQQELFAQEGFKNNPEVQAQYSQSQRPEVVERFRQADVNFLVATGEYVKKYPANEASTRELVRLIRGY